MSEGLSRVVVPGSRWRHYEGGVYRIHSLSEMKPTGEVVVNYQALLRPELPGVEPKMYSRLLYDFLGQSTSLSDYGEGRFILHPVTHHLKTWPEYFQAVLSGEKNFDVRKADRLFCVGDKLDLEEWDNEKEQYTKRNCVRQVTYILDAGKFGMAPGYVVMGMK